MHQQFVRSRLIANWSKLYLAVALGGECGELLNVVKKEHRDKVDSRESVREEAGDVLFYLVAFLDKWGLSIEECLDANREKLSDADWAENFAAHT